MTTLNSRARRRLLQASLGSAALIGLSRKSLAADDKILIGYWPIADLPYTSQENMPLEETAWDLLVIAAIALAGIALAARRKSAEQGASLTAG